MIHRNFSIGGRAAVLSAQINGTPSRDSETLGYYQFNYDNATGDYTDVWAGMTLDIGTTAGARDIGSIRVRKAPTSSIMYIAESSQGRLPLADNLYITVREEFLPWRVLPRGVGAQLDGATYTNDLTLYMDYDIEYTDQNENIPPKANITRSAVSSLAPKPAGYLDNGQIYRTIVLSSALSHAMAHSTTIASREWFVGDCTITVGTSTSTTITIRVPEGFRYIHLIVIDSNGTEGVMHFPLWAHGETDQPLVNFAISSDETNDLGRSITFEFFGEENSVSEVIFPRLSLVCYWEEEDDTQPDGYRDQYLGWSRRESTILRLHRTRYILETTGIAGWLDLFGGSSLYIYDPLETPDRWYEMQNIIIDRVAYFILLYFSNAMTICNFYVSGDETPSKGETIEIGSVWRQLVEMVKGYYGVANADSLNGIWLRINFSYLTDDERNAVDEMTTVTRDDLEDGNPVVFRTELTDQIGLVIGGGSSFDGTTNTIYASAAPGRVMGDEAGEATAPGVRLPVSDPQAELNRLTGLHHGFVNNRNPDVPLDLIDNIDIFEVAYMRPIIYQEDMGSVSGITINKRLIPKSISVRHANKGRGKRIRVNCYAETFDSGADYREVTEYENNPPIFPPPPVTPPTTGITSPIDIPIGTIPSKFFALSYGGKAARADSLSLTTGPDWEEISTGLTGDGMWACSDPYNYFRRFALTSDGLFMCNDIWVTSPSWTLVATNAQMFGDAGRIGHKVIMSHNLQGWIMVLSGQTGVAVSFDYGGSWVQSSLSGGAAAWGTTSVLYYGDFGNAHISGFNDISNGVIWGLYSNQFVKSIDWGLTWSAIVTTPWGTIGNFCVPYKRIGGADNIADSSQLLYYWNAVTNETHLYISTNAGVSWSDLGPGAYSNSDTFPYRGAQNGMNAYTLDGGVLIAPRPRFITGFSKSVNGGASWAIAGNYGAAWMWNVNGFPTNEDFAIFFRPGCNAYGDTSGAVWLTLDGTVSTIPSTPSFFTDGFTAYAEADLSQYITSRG